MVYRDEIDTPVTMLTFRNALRTLWNFGNVPYTARSLDRSRNLWIWSQERSWNEQNAWTRVNLRHGSLGLRFSSVTSLRRILVIMTSCSRWGLRAYAWLTDCRLKVKKLYNQLLFMASVKLALWAGRVGSSSRRVALSRGSWKAVSVAVFLRVHIPSTLLPHSSLS